MRVLAGFSSAAKAAAELGVSTIHLHNIERGAAGASPSLIERLARLLHKDEDAVKAAIRHQRKILLKRQHNSV